MPPKKKSAPVKKKPAPAKRERPQALPLETGFDLFSGSAQLDPEETIQASLWCDDVWRFYAEHKISEIDSFQHPRIHQLDQLIKMSLDGLLSIKDQDVQQSLKAISPLYFLGLVFQSMLRNRLPVCPKTSIALLKRDPNLRFLKLAAERIADSISLREAMKNNKKGDHAYLMAYTEMRNRGLAK